MAAAGCIGYLHDGAAVTTILALVRAIALDLPDQERPGHQGEYNEKQSRLPGGGGETLSTALMLRRGEHNPQHPCHHPPGELGSQELSSAGFEGMMLPPTS
jgi:hypothetical protein